MKDRECQMCGDLFNGTPKARFCPSCKRIKNLRYKRKTEGWKGTVLGEGRECAECGKSFIVRAGAQKFCSAKCRVDAQARRLGAKLRNGEPIVCLVCGKTIPRTGTWQLYCHEPCEGEVECIECGDVKHSSCFYDYRGSVGSKKFNRCCKACLKKRRENVKRTTV
jgi:endogenous inhibitor of DNA gyrase (YacG/DUF329 family)